MAWATQAIPALRCVPRGQFRTYYWWVALMGCYMVDWSALPGEFPAVDSRFACYFCTNLTSLPASRHRAEWALLRRFQQVGNLRLAQSSRRPNPPLLQELCEKNSTQVGYFFFKALIVVSPFKRPGQARRQFDWAIFANEDIQRPHIACLPPPVVKFLHCREQGQCKIPQFILFEVFGAEALSIVDLIAEDKGIILEDNLNGRVTTRTTPADPQKPDFSKECEMGRRRASCEPILESSSAQAVYSFWEGTATEMAMVSSPS